MLKLLFFLCIASLSLGQLVVLHRSDTGGLNLFDLVVLTFALYGTVFFFAKRSFVLPKTLMFYLFFVVFAGVVSLPNFFVLSTDELGSAFFYLARFFFYLLAGIIVYNMKKHSLLTTEEILRAFLYSGLLVSMAGFLQLIILPDFAVLDKALGFDPHKNRLASTFFDPNFTGAYLVLCLAAALELLSRSGGRSRRLAILSGLIFVVGIVLTFSRSSWAMFAVVVLVYGLLKRYRWLIATAFLAVFLAYYTVPRVQTRVSGTTDPADSAHYRLISWRNTLAIAKDNLLLGVGFNSFRHVQKEYGFFGAGTLGGSAGAGSDSSFLLVLATTGVLGFAIFLISYFYPIFVSSVRGKEETSGFSPKPFIVKSEVLIVAISLGLLLHSQFVNSFFFPPILFMYFSLISSFSRT